MSPLRNRVFSKCYVFRAFSPSGSIWRTSKFLKQPAQYDHLLKSFREVLQKACGLTPDQTLGYSCHRSRHFLPEVVYGRVDPETCRVDLGRFKGSVVQMSNTSNHSVESVAPRSGVTRYPKGTWACVHPIRVLVQNDKDR